MRRRLLYGTVLLAVVAIGVVARPGVELARPADHTPDDEWIATVARAKELEGRDPDTLGVGDKQTLDNYVTMTDWKRRFPGRMEDGWEEGRAPDEVKRMRADAMAEFAHLYPWASTASSDAFAAGRLYDELGEPELAEEVHRVGIACAEALIEAHPNAAWMGFPCLSVMMLFNAIQEPTVEDAMSARAYAEIALATPAEDRRPATEGRLYLELARLHNRVGLWDQAEEYARKALEHKRELRGWAELFPSVELGRAQAGKGDTETAIRTFQQVIDACPEEAGHVRQEAEDEIRRLGGVPQPPAPAKADSRSGSGRR